MKRESFEKMQTFLLWSSGIGVIFFIATSTLNWVFPFRVFFGFCLALLCEVANVNPLLFENRNNVIAAIILAILVVIGTIIAIIFWPVSGWIIALFVLPYIVGVFYFHFADI